MIDDLKRRLAKLDNKETKMKKLKIKFWKAERALAMQILEQEGLPKVKEEGMVKIMGYPDLYSDSIFLRGENNEFNLDVSIKRNFVLNSNRDEYLNKITNAITDELFTGTSELKVGEMCEAWNDGECDSCQRVYAGIVAKQLGSKKRHLVRCIHDPDLFMRFEHAIPVGNRTEPKVEVNGEIVTYTWEEE